MIHLPDDPQLYVTRKYLINIVNTLDSSFFPKTIDEIQSQRQAIKIKQEVVHVSEPMIKLLSTMQQLILGVLAGMELDFWYLKNWE